jgi:hypothetical protein
LKGSDVDLCVILKNEFDTKSQMELSKQASNLKIIFQEFESFLFFKIQRKEFIKHQKLSDQKFLY